MRKKDRPLYFSITVIVILLGVIFFLLRDKTTAPVNLEDGATTSEEKGVATTPPAQVVDESLVEEKKSTTTTRYTANTVTYPQFKNVSPAFNAEIAKVVSDTVAEHNEISADNWQARYETQVQGENLPQYPSKEDLLPLTISWTPTQINDRFISFVLSFDQYSGGAHGAQWVISFNYDPVEEKKITLKNLFPDDPNYLKTLSDFSRKSLEAQFRKALNVKTKEDEANFKDAILPMLLEGTKPTLDNFSTFTFTDSVINIYFAQYQVGPYVLGAPTVSFARQ